MTYNSDFYPKWDRDTSWLDRLGHQFWTDKNADNHDYLQYYERYLGYLQLYPITLLEIGVGTGNSIRMWHDYFPKAKIIGVDISPPLNNFPHGMEVKDSGRIRIDICDIKNYDCQDELDVVIDDGSHIAEDIFIAMGRLWPHLKPTGWYIIEDWNTQSGHERDKFGPYGNIQLTREILEHYSLNTVYDNEDRIVHEVHIHPEITFFRKEK